jgi:hypothetical protein
VLHRLTDFHSESITSSLQSDGRQLTLHAVRVTIASMQRYMHRGSVTRSGARSTLSGAGDGDLKEAQGILG